MTREDATVAENRPERAPESKPETWPRKIRTTMEPGREIEVDEAEYLELSRRRLIHNPKGGN